MSERLHQITLSDEAYIVVAMAVGLAFAGMGQQDDMAAMWLNQLEKYMAKQNPGIVLQTVDEIRKQFKPERLD